MDLLYHIMGCMAAPVWDGRHMPIEFPLSLQWLNLIWLGQDVSRHDE